MFLPTQVLTEFLMESVVVYCLEAKNLSVPEGQLSDFITKVCLREEDGCDDNVIVKPQIVFYYKQVAQGNNIVIPRSKLCGAVISYELPSELGNPFHCANKSPPRSGRRANLISGA